MARERKNTSTEEKAAKAAESNSQAQNSSAQMTEAELKNFLMGIRDKMSEGTCPAIFSLSSMNFILNQSNIYDILNKENKELARDVWLRIKKSGLQVKEPPVLFEAGI